MTTSQHTGPRARKPYTVREAPVHRLADIDDLAFVVYPHFMLHSAHTAGLERMPRLAELGSVGVGRRFDDEPLVGVLPASLARVRASDAGSAILRDHGLSAGGGTAEVRVAGVPSMPGTVAAPILSNSRKLPIAPMSPAASDGKKTVDPLPAASCGSASK